jgi:hypothetical protein
LLKADSAFGTKYYPEIKISAYDGDYRNSSIEMVRHTWYNNSFKPVIRGTVNTVNDNCSIELRLSLNVVALIVVIIFLALSLLGGGALVISITFKIFEFFCSAASDGFLHVLIHANRIRPGVSCSAEGDDAFVRTMYVREIALKCCPKRRLIHFWLLTFYQTLFARVIDTPL